MATGRDPVLRMLRDTRYRAKKRGIAYDLKPEDVAIPAFCPVLGIPLYRNTGGACQSDNSPTIDRIKPERGYVAGNVIVISARANAIKSNATPAELLKVACFYMEERTH